jgi:NitT/TauT family transport system ATP-binding protein
LRRVFKKVLGRFSGRRLLVPFQGRSGLAKIAISRLGHRYANVEALKNVNIDIHAGQFVCLLGPSGCGKSTLLYALAGHFAPSGGHIAIDGRAVDGPSPERLLMFQEPALFPWLTVKQNLKFALRAKGLSRSECERVARQYINLVHLEGFGDALPHQLSGGMRMRASLARALAMDPSVLLMDEPFASLDAQTRAHMHQLLQSIWMKSRKTVVFVTHNVREALVLGDRVVVMANRPGRILQDLEVRLPRPRDPDDEKLVQMSRQIRDELRRAELSGQAAKTEPTLGSEDSAGEDDVETETPAATGSVSGGVAGPVGARR